MAAVFGADQTTVNTSLPRSLFIIATPLSSPLFGLLNLFRISVSGHYLLMHLSSSLGLGKVKQHRSETGFCAGEPLAKVSIMDVLCEASNCGYITTK